MSFPTSNYSALETSKSMFKMVLKTTKFQVFLVLLACFSRQKKSSYARDVLQIGGLFGIDTSQGGWNSKGIIPAVEMAFEDINNSTKILQDYKLELLIKDSKVSRKYNHKVLLLL